MKKLLLILLCLPMIGFGQLTYVPDDNFEAYLEANGMGNGIANDDYVTTANINTVTGIHLGLQNITDLTGIEGFTALTGLICSHTQLTSLDLSNNTQLVYLECPNNYQLTTLDVSNCTALHGLYCNDCQITSLDVSNNILLNELDCGDNQLTTLDVSNKMFLTKLNCYNNQLTTLDVGNNIRLGRISCENNLLATLDVSNLDSLKWLNCDTNQLNCLDISNTPVLKELTCSYNNLHQLNLKNGNWANIDYLSATNNNLACVEVDNIGYATNNWSSFFDNTVTFNTNCNYTNPCNTTSAIKEHTTNKELLKVTDLLGRETKGTKNEVLFYIYDDGTVEKRITIE